MTVAGSQVFDDAIGIDGNTAMAVDADGVLASVDVAALM